VTRLLGAPFTDAEREAVIAEARRLRVARLEWRHQGRRQEHADCIGFVELSFRPPLAARGIEVPKTRQDYGRQPSADKLHEEMVRYFGPPVAREPVPADAVTIHWAAGERHLAIVVPHRGYGLGLIHCDNQVQRADGTIGVVEHGIDAHWRARIAEVFSP
jgi:hypothetical protein